MALGRPIINYRSMLLDSEADYRIKLERRTSISLFCAHLVVGFSWSVSSVGER
jgi:hypothetical protein